MVVQQPVDAMTVGKRYACEIQDQPGLRELWVRDNRGEVELFLIVDPIDDDAERRLFGASIVLYEAFPELNFFLHIVNPRFEDPGVPDAIPHGAVLVPFPEPS